MTPAKKPTLVTTTVHFGDGANPILSNFHESPISFRGKIFRTAEGAYHAHKSGVFVPGFETLDGYACKRQSTALQLKRGSNTISIMREILEAKWQQCEGFRKALAAGSHFTHPVKDPFWSQHFPVLLEELKKAHEGEEA